MRENILLLTESKFYTPRGDIAIYQHIGGDFLHGKIINGQVINTFEDHNLIVDTASILMARRMAPGAITGAQDESFLGDHIDFGLRYCALGVGILQDTSLPYDEVTNNVDRDAYDLQNPPEPELNETTLLGEFYRKRFTNWCFMDAAGQETETATNILILDTTFYENEAVGPITEIALFGGDALPHNNDAGKDSGLMFNLKRFKVINKQDNHRISIRWKLTF